MAFGSQSRPASFGGDEAAFDAALAGGQPVDAVAGAEDAPSQSQSQLASDLAAEKERSLRLLADLENVRSRTARELVEQSRYAALPLVRDLLPVLDNIDRAIDHAGQSADASSLLEGFKLVRQQLAATLKRHDCEEVAALGESFDPNFHSAILQQPSDDVPAGHIVTVAQPGYRMHDRVVRPAQVIVSSGPAEG